METDDTPPPPRGAPHSRRRAFLRKVRLVLLVNLASFAGMGLLAEVGLRVFWHPRFWVRCDDWLVGSGQAEAGTKWWPDAHYEMVSPEFRVRYRCNAQGYRARPAPIRTADPYRLAFVGDSFTEAAQVEYDQTFVARVEAGLTARSRSREIIADNYGIAGTGIFEYWHRIAHDVFGPGTRAPEAVVLCIYPNNDFTDFCPDDGFEVDGRPKRTYFGRPTWSRHTLAWLTHKSKLAFLLVRTLKIGAWQFSHPQPSAPGTWWADPAVAANVDDAPAVRHVRSLLRAIESECDHHSAALVVVVVGPVKDYAAKGRPSPIAQIFGNWGIKAPVIDVAIAANACAAPGKLVYFHDGHLNPAGHRFLSGAVIDPLDRILDLSASDETSARPRGFASECLP